MPISKPILSNFPKASGVLETFGPKFSVGGAHISRTKTLGEREDVLAAVPTGAEPSEYSSAISIRNILGKITDSTRLKPRRHLREFHALDERIPNLHVLRALQRVDSGASMSLLALLTAWARAPLLRATTAPVLEAKIDQHV